MKHLPAPRRDRSIAATCRRELSLHVRKVESKKLYRRSRTLRQYDW